MYSPCLQQFIEVADSVGEEDSLEAQREAYSLSSQSLQLQVPASVGFYDEIVQTREHRVPVRYYRRNDIVAGSLIIYFHGGGWVKGDLNSHHEVVACMAQATGTEVLAVDYPLAPENRHPAQLLAAYSVLQHIATRRAAQGVSGPLLVAGDSAGGQIAASLCLLARQEGGPTISGQVLIYPALDHRCNSDSFWRCAGGPLLTDTSMREYWKALVPHSGETTNFLSPLLEKDMSGLPPSIIQLAQNDVLHDEAVAYAVRLDNQGVPVEILEGAGMVHGFVRAIGLSEEARAEFARLCGRISALTRRLAA